MVNSYDGDESSDLCERQRWSGGQEAGGLGWVIMAEAKGYRIEARA